MLVLIIEDFFSILNMNNILEVQQKFVAERIYVI